MSINTINPATEQVCGTYEWMNKNEVGQIIEQMQDAQQKWATTELAIRKKHMLNLGKVLQKEKQKLALMITQEMGKPIQQSIAEIEKCALLCKFYANQAKKLLKPEQVKTEFTKSYRAFEPLGTIFAIMPWNFPVWQVMRFAVPNVMGGNAALLKHAPNCIGTSLLIENLFLKAGFPNHLFRSLIMDVDLAPFVIHHPAVAGVTLTGSNRAGKSVAKEAGEAIKKVVLELGGSDPYLILDDADLELAAEQCVLSRLNNCGQVCIAAKRMIVVQSVKRQFEALILKKAKCYQMGDPENIKTTLGPMARADLRENLHDQVQRSIAAGARCVLGGVMPEGKGFFYPATVLCDVKPDSPAFHEELFGPVICITEAENESHAIELANQSPFGLAGAVFTQDLKRGEHIARELLKAGTCAVNSLVASDPRLPFGGIKQSGYGRELSTEGMREFMNIKTIVVAKH